MEHTRNNAGRLPRLLLVALLLVAAVIVAIPVLRRAAPEWQIARLVRPKYLNDEILSLAETMTRQGGYNILRDAPPSSSLGVTRTIHYQGRTVAKPATDRGIYCIGLLFDVYLKACENVAGEGYQLNRVSTTNFAQFRRDFYGTDGNDRTFVRALVDRGLGEEISNRDDALPGDLVQYWRTSGSGHAVVFLEWERDASGTIQGMLYWGTAKGSLGVGQQQMGKVTRLYIVRPLSP